VAKIRSAVGKTNNNRNAGRKKTHVGKIKRRLDIWLTEDESIIWDTIDNRAQHFTPTIRANIANLKATGELMSVDFEIAAPVGKADIPLAVGHMLTIVIPSLKGGQGKTTLSMLLGFRLSALGFSTLLIDADPQHDLTDWLGLTIDRTSPTLSEFVKDSAPIKDCIYATSVNDNLFCIPADDSLTGIQEYLVESGVGAILLKTRLAALSKTFDICIIDSPPARSPISIMAFGAADVIVIAVEASIKGYGSLVRTIDMLDHLLNVRATAARLLGVVPVKDRWVGNNQTSSCRDSIEAMREDVGADLMLPALVDSERYKQAIIQRKGLTQLGYPLLDNALDVLVGKISDLKGGANE
jgi:chromosome partitioning protein